MFNIRQMSQQVPLSILSSSPRSISRSSIKKPYADLASPISTPVKGMMSLSCETSPSTDVSACTPYKMPVRYASVSSPQSRPASPPLSPGDYLSILDIHRVYPNETPLFEVDLTTHRLYNSAYHPTTLVVYPGTLEYLRTLFLQDPVLFPTIDAKDPFTSWVLDSVLAKLHTNANVREFSPSSILTYLSCRWNGYAQLSNRLYPLYMPKAEVSLPLFAILGDMHERNTVSILRRYIMEQFPRKFCITWSEDPNQPGYFIDQYGSSLFCNLNDGEDRTFLNVEPSSNKPRTDFQTECLEKTFPAMLRGDYLIYQAPIHASILEMSQMTQHDIQAVLAQGKITVDNEIGSAIPDHEDVRIDTSVLIDTEIKHLYTVPEGSKDTEFINLAPSVMDDPNIFTHNTKMKTIYGNPQGIIVDAVSGIYNDAMKQRDSFRFNNNNNNSNSNPVTSPNGTTSGSSISSSTGNGVNGNGTGSPHSKDSVADTKINFSDPLSAFTGTFDYDIRGFADFLIRRPSSDPEKYIDYEVWDAKLAKRLNPNGLVQVTMYASALNALAQKHHKLYPHTPLVRVTHCGILMGNGKGVSFPLSLIMRQLMCKCIGMYTHFLESYHAFVPPLLPKHTAVLEEYTPMVTNMLTQTRSLLVLNRIQSRSIGVFTGNGVFTLDDLYRISICSTKLSQQPILLPTTTGNMIHNESICPIVSHIPYLPGYISGTVADISLVVATGLAELKAFLSYTQSTSTTSTINTTTTTTGTPSSTSTSIRALPQPYSLYTDDTLKLISVTSSSQQVRDIITSFKPIPREPSMVQRWNEMTNTANSTTERDLISLDDLAAERLYGQASAIVLQDCLATLWKHMVHVFNTPDLRAKFLQWNNITTIPVISEEEDMSTQPRTEYSNIHAFLLDLEKDMYPLSPLLKCMLLCGSAPVIAVCGKYETILKTLPSPSCTDLYTHYSLPQPIPTSTPTPTTDTTTTTTDTTTTTSVNIIHSLVNCLTNDVTKLPIGDVYLDLEGFLASQSIILGESQPVTDTDVQTYNPTSIIEEPESSRIEYLIGIAYKDPCITWLLPSARSNSNSNSTSITTTTMHTLADMIQYDATSQTYTVACTNVDNHTIHLVFDAYGVFTHITNPYTDLDVDYIYLEHMQIHQDKFTNVIEDILDQYTSNNTNSTTSSNTVYTYSILHNIFRTILTGGFVCFKSWWSHTQAQEQRSFAQCMDWIMHRRQVYPSMRMYHYASYEPSAFRRLAEQQPTDTYKLYLRQNPSLFYDIYDVIPKFADFSGRGHGLKQTERLVLGVVLNQLRTKEAANLPIHPYHISKILSIAREGVSGAVDSMVVYAQWVAKHVPYLQQLNQINSSNSNTTTNTTNISLTQYSVQPEVSVEDLANIKQYNKSDCINLLLLTETLWKFKQNHKF